jgi:hypothetical protein
MFPKGELARRWYADSHVAFTYQTKAMTKAPPFSSIVRERRFAARLELFLLSPHPIRWKGL